MHSRSPTPRDLSWGKFLGALGLLVVLAGVFLPVPSRGPDGLGVVPSDCLGSLTAALIVGILTIVSASASLSRLRGRTYVTPRRDIALGAIVMFLVLTQLWPLACYPLR